jgi:hypothetical protein
MHIEIPHGCGRTHGGYQSLAECTWPDVAYVVGDGAFALLARCDLFTVALYETRAEARRRKRALDANGCGKTCEGRHELIALVGDLDPLPPLDVTVEQSAVEWLTS